MNKIVKYIVALSMLFSAFSCSDFLDINTDVSVPQKVQASAIFTPVLAQIPRGEAFDVRYISRYIQNVTLNTSGGDIYERHGYAVAPSDLMGDIWRQHYYAIGTNIDLIIEDASSKQQWDMVGAAKAIRAWSWQTTTDYHGEIILDQAWEPNRYVFEFDSQEKVYAHVVKICNEALADLDKGGVPNLKAGDNVYNGDVAKWRKFIYSILARNANHLSNKSIYKPDDVIKYCDLSLATNADNFGIPHNGSNTSDANFYGPLRANLLDYRPTTTIMKLVDGTTFGGVRDPRLPIMFAPSRDTVYRGLQTFTTDPNNAANAPKRILNLFGLEPGIAAPAGFTGRWIYADKAPHYVVTAAEIQFIKAEAAFRKGDKAMALAAFRKGVETHMQFCSVTTANITAFLASAAVPQAAADLKMSDIMQQKYIALYMLGAIETWVDMRRFKYDPTIYTTYVMPVGTQYYPDNNGKLAYRVRPRYNSEYVWNRPSLEKIGGNNPDYHTYETWFVKP